jgi:hypothetical protein
VVMARKNPVIGKPAVEDESCAGTSITSEWERSC